MKIDIQLNRYRKARIWVDELPNITASVVSTQRIELSAKGSAPTMHMLACEFYIPLGARSLYGLLGCKFILKNEKIGKIAINAAPRDGSLFNDSLRGVYETVRFGLLEEYVTAVVAGLNMVELMPRAGVDFICAAHGQISSASIIYKHLAVLLMKLSQFDILKMRDGELIKLFPEDLDWLF